MPIYMKSIPYGATREDIVHAIAAVVQRPPFPSTPSRASLMFDVTLLGDQRSKKSHRGEGFLTLPDEALEQLLLETVEIRVLGTKLE